MAGSPRCGASARSRPDVSPPLPEGGTTAVSIRLRADRNLPADGGPRVRDLRAGGGRRLAGPRGGHVPAQRLAASEDPDVTPLRAAVAAVADHPSTLPGRAPADATAVPELRHWRIGHGHRLPQGTRRGGGWGRVEAGGDSLEDVPSH